MHYGTTGEYDQYGNDMAARAYSLMSKQQARKDHRAAKIEAMKNRSPLLKNAEYLKIHTLDYFKIPEYWTLIKNTRLADPEGWWSYGSGKTFSDSKGTHADQVRSDKDLAILEWVRIVGDRHMSGRRISIYSDEVILDCNAAIRSSSVDGIRILDGNWWWRIEAVMTNGKTWAELITREEYENLRSMAVQNQ